jgi:hypothetical protein
LETNIQFRKQLHQINLKNVREEKTIVITSLKLKLPYLHGTEITEQQETLQCHLPIHNKKEKDNRKILENLFDHITLQKK